MPAKEADGQGSAREGLRVIMGLAVGAGFVAIASGFFQGSGGGNGNTAPASSAPRTAGEATHTEHAAPAPKPTTAKAIGGISFVGIAFKDESGSVTVVTCYGDPPEHATKFSQLHGVTTDSYNSGDTANGVSCLLNITTMTVDKDAYAGVASVPVDGSAYVTGTANGNQALSTHQ